MKIDERIKILKEHAIKCGASSELTRYITTDNIEVADQWVKWKCQFGCPVYGNNLCCPPFTPNSADTKKLLKEYKHALLIGFKTKATEHIDIRKKVQRCILKIESKAFSLNFLKAFTFNIGACVWCETCIVKDLPKNINPQLARSYCKHKDKARPSMEAVGIDVFGTVENTGLKLNILSADKKEDAKFFGLILLE
ncbi:MAG: DUF2284 domain-containing protein [Candidatus Helarchaeota archaeon]